METDIQQANPATGELAGKVAIITGASRGIGRATAQLFAAKGGTVVLAARDEAALAANVQAIEAAGGRALAIPTDVADEASVAVLFARTTEVFGPVDILVNSAGAVANVPFEQMDVATWETVLGTNLRGTFLCCREAFRAMILSGGGVIVNFSSLSGVPKVEKFPGLSAYVVSKFGVAGLSEILAIEGHPHNIRVVAVSPGAVDTEMLRQAAPHLIAGMTPEQMARILLFLVGPDAAPLHGTNLEIYSNA
ncbi:MAG TPA: SDR family oxidoreductase [Ktedonobacterales bacterium]|jgi:NAD(P)-dependent dehydrogenase (short-subunit alcohol dehydrogenase family)|nr:SDR family oxidoreductase [Ktedonobacterales bacterium]